MNIFKKIGGGFKWVGKKLLGLLRRGEILFAIKLATDLLPIPALDKIVDLVWKLDSLELEGKEKMAIALTDMLPILAEYGVEIDENSDLRLIVELALSIRNGKTRIIEEQG